MKRIWIPLLLTLLVAVSAVATDAQQLENRHMVELQLGAWNHDHDQGVETGFGNREVRLDVNGFTGGLSYGYFISEAVFINLNMGTRSASVDAALNKSQSYLESASVVYIFCGVRYFLPWPAHSSAFRPYLMGEIGPVVGSQTWVAGWNNGELRNGSQTTLGARFGAGVNFLLVSHLMSGVSLGYHVMSDFDEPVGGYSNYNGPMLAISFGYLFGGSRDQRDNSF